MRTFAISLLLALTAACNRDDGAPPLAHPSDSVLAQRASDTVRVRVETGRGPFVIEAYRDWAPKGVDRFAQLTQLGFYDGVKFFRVIDGFMAQFGIHGDPRVADAWKDRSITDDPVTHGNERGTITFATRGPDTRTTQLFINLVDNRNLDGMGFTPIGRIVEGMEVVDSLYKGYGEGAPDGSGPDQGRIASDGNDYLRRNFPKLDSIITARLVK